MSLFSAAAGSNSGAGAAVMAADRAGPLHRGLFAAAFAMAVLLTMFSNPAGVTTSDPLRVYLARDPAARAIDRAVHPLRAADRCRNIAPGEDATVFWPERQTTPDFNISAPLPPAREPLFKGAAVSRVWSVQLCADSSHAYRSAARRSGVKGDFDLKLSSKFTARKRYCGDDGCDGEFLVRREVGCPAESQLHLLQPHAETVQRAQSMGPDDISLYLEGAEFLLLKGTHVGDCVYSFPYAVTIPGTYRVLLSVVRSDWQSLNEDVDWYPPITFDFPLGQKVLVELGDPAASELAHSAVLNLEGRSNDLPRCSRREVSGRWVRKTSTAGMFNHSKPPITHRQIYGQGSAVGPATGPDVGYKWFTHLGEDIDWVPYACRRPDIDYEAVASCFKGKSISFRGDSQMRMLYNHFIARTCGSAESAKKNVNVQTLKGLPNCADLVTSFIADPLADLVTYPVVIDHNHSVGHDVIVANFGQHPASNHHWQSSKYWGAVEGMIVQAAGQLEKRLVSDTPPDNGSAAAAFVWIDTFPAPVRMDPYGHWYRDWRTGQRLQLFNWIADRITSSRICANPSLMHHGGCLHAYDVLGPIGDYALDHAHLYGAHAALDELSDQLLSMLCPAALGAED